MKLFKMEFEPAVGTSLVEAIATANQLADEHECTVKFTFNGIEYTVTKLQN